MITLKDRETLRHIQNRLVCLLERKGHEDGDVIVSTAVGKITLHDLKTMIYPQYKQMFIDYLTG